MALLRVSLLLAHILCLTPIVSANPGNAPFETCLEQKDHIQWSLTYIESNSSICGCELYRVCLKLKGLTEAISHSCVKPENCSTVGPSFKDAEELNNVPKDYEQCQIGAAGSTLYFLLKNGKGCAAPVDYANTVISSTAIPPAQAVAECRSINGWGSHGTVVKSCTGNPEYMECAWRVGLPKPTKNCSVIPFEVSPDPSPSPHSPECFCASAGKGCFDEAVALESSGYFRKSIMQCSNPKGVAEFLNELQKGYDCGVTDCYSNIKCNKFIEQADLDLLNQYFEVNQCPLVDPSIPLP